MDLYLKISKWFDKHVSAGVFILFLMVLMAILSILPKVAFYVVIFCFFVLIPFMIVLQIIHVWHIIKARGPNWQHPRCQKCNRSLPLEEDGITPKKCEE